MGLFEWLFGKLPNPRAFLAGDGCYNFEIVGESFYQDALLHIVGEKTEDEAQHECTATLLLDDRNPHDRNAVAVFIDGHKVGHLSREDARDFRTFIAHTGLRQAECSAIINGGWKRRKSEGSFGVMLDLEWPPRLEQKSSVS